MCIRIFSAVAAPCVARVTSVSLFPPAGKASAPAKSARIWFSTFSDVALTKSLPKMSPSACNLNTTERALGFNT
ncbi:hypothetical protein Barb6_03780 [Bacteroidales bacterium Barb6]|nr:hypothetical protein Barb6_03780 [Bacteroidales bacterium Barb6]